LLDTMVLRKTLGDVGKTDGDISTALRRYESTRRRKAKAVSWVTTQQVSRSEAVLRPVALIPNRVMTWALTAFLGWASHRGISAEISRDALAQVS
jgi:FAD-dependent urate hydroxylase